MFWYERFKNYYSQLDKVPFKRDIFKHFIRFIDSINACKCYDKFSNRILH